MTKTETTSKNKFNAMSAAIMDSVISDILSRHRYSALTPEVLQDMAEIYKKVPLESLRYKEIAELSKKHVQNIIMHQNLFLRTINLIFVEYFIYSHEKFNISSEHLDYANQLKTRCKIVDDDYQIRQSTIFGLCTILDRMHSVKSNITHNFIKYNSMCELAISIQECLEAICEDDEYSTIEEDDIIQLAELTDNIIIEHRYIDELEKIFVKYIENKEFITKYMEVLKNMLLTKYS